jgi:hypothetical protein
MDNDAITEVVTQYMAAWNEPDDTARHALLAQCWSDSGVYLDPNVSLVGRDALATKIGEVLASRPGARLEFNERYRRASQRGPLSLAAGPGGRNLRRYLDRFWRGGPRRPAGQDRRILRPGARAAVNCPGA